MKTLYFISSTVVELIWLMILITAFFVAMAEIYMWNADAHMIASIVCSLSGFLFMLAFWAGNFRDLGRINSIPVVGLELLFLYSLYCGIISNTAADFAPYENQQWLLLYLIDNPIVSWLSICLIIGVLTKLAIGAIGSLKRKLAMDWARREIKEGRNRTLRLPMLGCPISRKVIDDLVIRTWRNYRHVGN